MQLLKNGTMALIASIFFQPQITCILGRNCLLRGVFQKNVHSQKKFMLIGRRAPQPDLITRSWSYKVWRLNSSLCGILFKNVTNCQALVPSPRSSPLDTNPFPKQSKTLKSKSDWEWGDRSEEPCHVGTSYSFPFL